MSGPSGAPESARRRVAAAILATGDELVTGVGVDTNSAAIAARLSELGVETERFVVLGDDEVALAAAVVDLGSRCDAIVITGGLGPTLDDVTRSAVARAAGVELELSSATLAELEDWFARHGRAFASSNERQAWFPHGSEVLPNPLGTAPGFAVSVGRAHVFALPGPPREMHAMLAAEVLPRIARRFSLESSSDRSRFYLFGLSEGEFADTCGPWMDRSADPLLGVTASCGVLSATLAGRTLSGATPLARRTAEFRERFARWIFSDSSADLALATGAVLLERKVSVATAESCTGGLVAERLTGVPGISAVFDRGYVTYSDRSKSELLGVDPARIEAHGAVSGEVAEAMARGAAQRSGSRLAVSVTGIAGPSGGSPEKPIGLVWFGVALDGRVRAEERRFPARGREFVRELAANTALDLLRRAALGERPPD